MPRTIRKRPTDNRSAKRSSVPPIPPLADPAIPSTPLLNLVCSLLILAATLIAFEPVLNNELTYLDDDQNFINNPHIRSVSSDNLRWILTTNLLGVWQPLTWLLTALQYKLILGKDAPTLTPEDLLTLSRGLHAFNIALHALAALLVYFLARRLIASAAPGRAAASPEGLAVGAMIAALTFAVHPLRAEIVAWASAQPYILAIIPSLLCLWFYLLAHAKRSRAFYILSIASLIIALLCKSIAVPLIAVLLILDFFPLRRIAGPSTWRPELLWRILSDKIPYALAVLAVSCAAIWATASTQGELSDPPLKKLMISGYCFLLYAFHTLLPLHLAPYYARPDPFNYNDPLFIAAPILGFLITLALLIFNRRTPWLLATWLAYLTILSPNVGLIRHGGQMAADRYAYLSCIGWAVLLGALVLRLWSFPKAGPPRRIAQSAVVLFALALTASLIALTRPYCDKWQNNLILWTAIAEGNPNSPMGYYDLSKEYNRIGDWKKKEEYLRKSLAIKPRYWKANVDLGNILRDKYNDIDGAIALYNRAFTGKSDFYMAHYNLGRAYESKGDLPRALEHYQLALQHTPPADLGRIPSFEHQIAQIKRRLAASQPAPR